MADILENYFEDGYYQGTSSRIHFKHRSGDGRILVFLHGLGSDVGTWRKLMAYMPDGLDIYLVDLIGHGGSSMPSSGYTARVQAAALEEFFRGYGIISPCLIGHSYGGWVAAIVASSGFPLAGLILIDCAGLKEKFDDVVSSGKLKVIRGMLLENAIEAKSNNPEAMKIIVESMDRELLDHPLLSKIHMPVLIVWGSSDPLLALEYSRYFIEAISGSSIAVVGGAGHSPHYTHPAIVANHLLDFLATKL